MFINSSMILSWIPKYGKIKFLSLNPKKMFENPLTWVLERVIHCKEFRECRKFNPLSVICSQPLTSSAVIFWQNSEMHSRTESSTTSQFRNCKLTKCVWPLRKLSNSEIWEYWISHRISCWIWLYLVYSCCDFHLSSSRSFSIPYRLQIFAKCRHLYMQMWDR